MSENQNKAVDSIESAEKPKKKGKAGKVIIIIVVILAVLALLAGLGIHYTLRRATQDTIPMAPSASDVDMKTVAIDAAAEVIQENTITIDAEKINTILVQVKDTVNGSTDQVRVDDLFCELADNKGVIYGRVYVKEVPVGGMKVKLDKVFPIQVNFDVDFEAPEIVVIPEKIMCGSIDFPMDKVAQVLDGVKLPENMRAEGGKIYYDTSTLDSQIDAVLAAQITESVNSSEVLGLIGNIFGEDAAEDIAGKVTDYAVSFATDATDVQLTDAQIEGDKLIISGQIM